SNTAVASWNALTSAGLPSTGSPQTQGSQGTNAVGQATGNNVFGAFVAAQFKF
ncbi:MAG: hypothetical protein RLZZ515_1757, partial [Cyanobacteriota bacterium]